ncbi:zona pellucida protein C [Odontesthes bonariensis]|uniref:zona pellucida protein C n=1 Tax=Odontesthes bonariensis TaxID=219752 RepID=UPI003F580FE9
MGTIQQVLCIFLVHFIAVNSFMGYEDDMFPLDFGGFFETDGPFPFEPNFDFLPFDDDFSSWKTWIPDTHMFAEFPPIMDIPKVQVSCDESKLTLMVDKKAFGLMLTRENMQLGDGCYSNKELPNQFVFSYDFNQCGTTLVLHEGLQAFTNSLHLSLKKTLPTQRQAPSSIHVFCTPKRSYDILEFTSHDQIGSFNIQAMDPSWTNTAESHFYKSGQMVNLQVSAKIRLDQQLFIQSCFVSASPVPHTRPRHTVVLNKGCSASLGSPYTVAQFVASNRADVVKLMLNTSQLISELYVHCSVLVSDQGVTSGSKSCNYNVIHSRWEELGGNVEVCDCCSSKCKGPSVKNHPGDTKAVVSIGPLVIVENDGETNLALVDSKPQTPPPNSMQSAPAEDHIVSGASVSRSKFLSSPESVVVVSQYPTARLTLWLPGEVHTDYDSNIISEHDLSGLLQSHGSNDPEQPLITEETLPSLYSNEIELHSSNEYKGDSSLLDMNLPQAVGWPDPEQPHNAVSAEEFQTENVFGRSETEPAHGDLSLPTEISINLMIGEPKSAVLDGKPITEEPQKKWLATETALNDINKSDFNPMKDEQPQMDAAPLSEDVAVQPIVRSKLEFSKHADGSQTLSYEEEVEQPEGKGHLGRSLRNVKRGKREPGLKGLHSTFLNLLRRMDKAE